MPASAESKPPGDFGGRGDDHGDASRPQEKGPEAAKADYSGAKWSAANKANYTNADRPHSDPIKKVIIHTMQGSYSGTKSWFKNANSEVSAHYIIRSKDGEITQMVHDEDIGWHAGNWDVNVESIGIEHEGYIDNPKKWFTNKMYESSAKLVASICDRYGIPVDRDHIIGHAEVPGADHTDPGKGWDWSKYMKLVKKHAVKPISMDNSHSKQVSYSRSWQTAHRAGDYGANYAYASPQAKSDPFWYNADIPKSGKYNVKVWYPSNSSYNNKTPYIIHTKDGYETVYVNQRSGGGKWKSIGDFDLKAGKYPAAGISRWTGGTGRIVADAIRFTQK